MRRGVSVRVGTSPERRPYTPRFPLVFALGNGPYGRLGLAVNVVNGQPQPAHAIDLGTKLVRIQSLQVRATCDGECTCQGVRCVSCANPTCAKLASRMCVSCLDKLACKAASSVATGTDTRAAPSTHPPAPLTPESMAASPARDTELYYSEDEVFFVTDLPAWATLDDM